jgi:hypothetical protein
MLSMGLGRPERILILNYNTVFLQSVGFVTYMNQSGLEHEFFGELDQFGLIYFFTRANTRNTASLIDPEMTEIEYFEFVKKKYREVSVASPSTAILPIINIVKSQNFVDKVFMASFSIYDELEVVQNVNHVFFDIFDVKEIEKFVLDNQITSIFLHDIRMVHDLVFNFNIDVKGMSFIVSKFGYNFTDVDGVVGNECPQVFELRDQLRFTIAYINTHDTTRGLGIIEI